MDDIQKNSTSQSPPPLYSTLLDWWKSQQHAYALPEIAGSHLETYAKTHPAPLFDVSHIRAMSPMRQIQLLGFALARLVAGDAFVYPRPAEEGVFATFCKYRLPGLPQIEWPSEILPGRLYAGSAPHSVDKCARQALASLPSSSTTTALPPIPVSNTKSACKCDFSRDDGAESKGECFVREALLSYGVTHQVNLMEEREEREDRPAHDSFCLVDCGIPDSPLAWDGAYLVATQTLPSLLAQNKTVLYLHCLAGYHRTMLVLTIYFIAVHKYTLAKTRRGLKARRPHAHLVWHYPKLEDLERVFAAEIDLPAKDPVWGHSFFRVHDGRKEKTHCYDSRAEWTTFDVFEDLCREQNVQKEVEFGSQLYLSAIAVLTRDCILQNRLANDQPRETSVKKGEMFERLPLRMALWEEFADKRKQESPHTYHVTREEIESVFMILDGFPLGNRYC